MARRPKIIHSIPILRKAVGGFREVDESLALVPTMGALHEGHLALIRLAKRRADRVAVSIFVNPAQFGPNEDFASYPRTFDSDVSKLSALGVDLVWTPKPDIMYPAGFATKIAPEGAASAGLEDRFRPHFFGGVATVVAKLFQQVGPDIAIFGEKDYQQLKVVTQVARDLDMPLRVIGAPTVREKDGLALSSRNAYLLPEERRLAPLLHGTLKQCAERIRAGEAVAGVLARGSKEIEKAGFALDYLEARNAENLSKIESTKRTKIRLLVAARIGKTRLIDNLAV